MLAAILVSQFGHSSHVRRATTKQTPRTQHAFASSVVVGESGRGIYTTNATVQQTATMRQTHNTRPHHYVLETRTRNSLATHHWHAPMHSAPVFS